MERRNKRTPETPTYSPTKRTKKIEKTKKQTISSPLRKSQRLRSKSRHPEDEEQKEEENQNQMIVEEQPNNAVLSNIQEQSNSVNFQIILPKLKPKKPKPNPLEIQEQFEIQECELSLITEIHFKARKPLNLKNLQRELTTYYYNYIGPSKNNKSKTKIDFTNQITQVLMDIFNKFSDSNIEKPTFYFINNYMTILFEVYKGQRYAFLSTKGNDTINRIQQHKIRHDAMYQQTTETFFSLIKNRSVRHFWNWCINQILQDLHPFEIISSFQFQRCQQQIPIEIFHQNRNARDKSGKVQEVIIKGYLLRRNFYYLQEMAKQGCFSMKYKTYGNTRCFQDIIVQKGFRYQMSDEPIYPRNAFWNTEKAKQQPDWIKLI